MRVLDGYRLELTFSDGVAEPLILQNASSDAAEFSNHSNPKFFFDKLSSTANWEQLSGPTAPIYVRTSSTPGLRASRCRRRNGKWSSNKAHRAAKSSSRSCNGPEPKSVEKKLKDKAFAAKVDRAIIQQGAEMLGVDLGEQVGLVIEALKPHAEELGIRRDRG